MMQLASWKLDLLVYQNALSSPCATYIPIAHDGGGGQMIKDSLRTGVCQKWKTKEADCKSTQSSKKREFGIANASQSADHRNEYS
jgi:hypothetical protein